MYPGSRSAQSTNPLATTAFASALLALVLALALAPAAHAGSGDTTGAQLDFGIEMAKRGLWNEAVFRFSRVLRERPGDVRVLNNLAVAHEAIGEFDLALEYYKKALEGDSSNRELRRNYAQFVEFYESLRPKTDDKSETADTDTDTDTDAGSKEKAEPQDDSTEGATVEAGDSD